MNMEKKAKKAIVYQKPELLKNAMGGGTCCHGDNAGANCNAGGTAGLRCTGGGSPGTKW